MNLNDIFFLLGFSMLCAKLHNKMDMSFFTITIVGGNFNLIVGYIAKMKFKPMILIWQCRLECFMLKNAETSKFTILKASAKGQGLNGSKKILI